MKGNHFLLMDAVVRVGKTLLFLEQDQTILSPTSVLENAKT